MNESLRGSRMVPPAVEQRERLGHNATYLDARVRDLQLLSRVDSVLAASRNLTPSWPCMYYFF